MQQFTFCSAAVDRCITDNPCKNGRCNHNGYGPMTCDCTGTDYTGEFCTVRVGEMFFF